MTDARTHHPADAEVRSVGRRVVGYAARFDTMSLDLGGYRERIDARAFDGIDLSAADVVFNLNHGDDYVLARTTAGTLRLNVDARGLRFEADLPDSPAGQNVREAVRRGDLTGASFRMVVGPGGEAWAGDVRTVTRIEALLDVALATRPAYPAAQVELRTQPNKATKEAPTVDTHDDTPAPAATTETTATTDAPDAEDRTAPETTAAPAAGVLRVEDRIHQPRPVADRLRDAMLDIRKGEARALTVASTLAPGELSTYLIDKLAATSIALASGIQVIRTEKDTITFPQLTADVAPDWYAEADDITAGDPTLTSIVATPRKLAHLVQFSNEVIEDSDPAALDVVRDSMLRALSLKLDLGIYAGSGSAPEIKGMGNWASIGTHEVGAGDGGGLSALDEIADGLEALETADATPGAIAMHPRTWNAIRKAKDADGRGLFTAGDRDVPRNLFGVPVYLSSQISITETVGGSSDCTTVYLYDPSQLYAIIRKDVEVELDRSRLFNTDQSELRGKLRADLIVPNPDAVYTITGITA